MGYNYSMEGLPVVEEVDCPCVQRSEMDRTRSRRHQKSIIAPALLEAAEASRVCREWSSVGLYFYISVVRPILEYACQVWHTGLTAGQSDALESVQKRAMRIIYSDDNSGDYKIRVIIAGIDTLKDRREVLTERLFKRHVLPSSSLLHYLLPDRRDNDTVNSLRRSQPLHKLRTRTTRFRNCFIPYCLNTYM